RAPRPPVRRGRGVGVRALPARDRARPLGPAGVAALPQEQGRARRRRARRARAPGQLRGPAGGAVRSGRHPRVRAASERHAGRASLAVALGAVTSAGIWRFGAGLLAGYFRGRTDSAVVQLVNFVLSLPFLLVAIALNRVIDDPSLWTLCLLLGALSWTTLAR